MPGNKQSQKSGDNSANIQGETVNITVNQGISVEDARSIAKDVFRQNALELADEAKKTFEERANHLYDKLIDKIQDAPESLNTFSDPDMQHAMFEAGKAYGRSGDENLEKVLIDILVERSKEAKQSTKQMILNESISVAGKLTTGQLNLVTEIFITRHTIKYADSLENLLTALDEVLSPW